ncbi:MAG: SprT family zinc-dependent metalloprotease [Bacteroidales bacterium]|nr:SprT family zinc-dependent metalloprotease [Bacteroidales bacterium]
MATPKKQDIILWKLIGVGDIYLKRNRKARKLSISIKPSGEVRVTVPGLLPLSYAKTFVEAKQDWITSKLNELSVLNQQRIISSGYKTREHELQFKATSASDIKVNFEEQYINVTHPEGIDTESEYLQNIAKEAIVEAYRKEAKAILPNRVSELAQKHNFKYNTLRIKNITSRWGSCSSVNNINLSLYLMKLPDELIDYIILHELAHTVHKNHGPNFWNLLDKLTGDAKMLSKRVKKYRTDI